VGIGPVPLEILIPVPAVTAVMSAAVRSARSLALVIDSP
jgi:hypothetical protein